MKPRNFFQNRLTELIDNEQTKEKKKRLLKLWIISFIVFLVLLAIGIGVAVSLIDGNKKSPVLVAEKPPEPDLKKVVFVPVKDIDVATQKEFTFSGEGKNNSGYEMKGVKITIFGNELTFSEENGNLFPTEEGEETLNEVTIRDKNKQPIIFRLTFKRVNGIVEISKISYDKPQDYVLDDSNKEIETEFIKKVQTFTSIMDSSKYFHSNKIRIKFQVNGELFEEDVEVEPTQALLTEKEITKTISVKADDEVAKKDIEVKVKLKITPKDEAELGTKESPVTYYQYEGIAEIAGGSEAKYKIEGFSEQVDSNKEKENNGLFLKTVTRNSETVNPFIYSYEQIEETKGNVYTNIALGILEDELPDNVFSLYETKVVYGGDGEPLIQGDDTAGSFILDAVVDPDKPEVVFTKEEIIAARKGLTSKELATTLAVFNSNIYGEAENRLYHVDKAFGDDNEYTVRLFFTYGKNYDDTGGDNPDRYVGTREEYSKYLLYGFGIALTDGKKRNKVILEKTARGFSNDGNIANYSIYDQTPIMFQQLSLESLAPKQSVRDQERSFDRNDYKQISIKYNIGGSVTDSQTSYYTLQIEHEENGAIKDYWETNVGLETRDDEYRRVKPEYYDNLFRTIKYGKLIAHPYFEVNPALEPENIEACIEDGELLREDSSGIRECELENTTELSFRVYKIEFDDIIFGDGELLGFVTRIRTLVSPSRRDYYYPNPDNNVRLEQTQKILLYEPSN